MSNYSGVVDALVLPPFAGDGLGELAYLFPEMRSRLKHEPVVDDLLAEMESAGVEKAILSVQSDAQWDWVAGACEQYPDHFIAALSVDPRNGLAEMRRIRSAVADLDIRVLRLGPWKIHKPPTDRVYWPVYAAAAEHNIPVQINVGIPGPKHPGWTQDPIYVDEVCYEFPELQIIMTHVGVPWTGTVVRNLIRWENCYLVMNSYAPRYWPEDLVHHLRTRGRTKFLFGTEYPLLSWRRALAEIEDLGLPDDVTTLLLRDNALRVFRWG